MDKALLLVDMQNDYFPGGAFPLPDMEQIAVKAARLLDFARASGIRVVHVRHEENDASTGFLLRGSQGAQIHPSVIPLRDENVVTKNYPNSFRETRLADELAGVKEVIIIGAMSNMCIDATVRAAFDLGFEVTVVADVCAASDLEFGGQTFPAPVVHGVFMAALASAYGKIVSAGELIECR